MSSQDSAVDEVEFATPTGQGDVDEEEEDNYGYDDEDEDDESTYGGDDDMSYQPPLVQDSFNDLEAEEMDDEEDGKPAAKEYPEEEEDVKESRDKEEAEAAILFDTEQAEDARHVTLCSTFAKATEAVDAIQFVAAFKGKAMQQDTKNKNSRSFVMGCTDRLAKGSNGTCQA